MKTVIQRVKSASVRVKNQIVGEIQSGLLVLVGFGRNDNPEVFKPTIEKIMHMRIFSNASGRFDHSVHELKGEVLLVPQFTLFADTSHGRRPEFFTALEPKTASAYFTQFAEEFKKISNLKVETGEFGADMQVELINDGPVTIIYESDIA